MSNGRKSQIWEFLNSNFGLFIMSSIVLSFITWSYTHWTESLEQKQALSETVTKLDTEISYRVQVMQNYFESECSDQSNLSYNTFQDIDEIYSAAASYNAIFPEHADKDLHTLIWEMSVVHKGHTKQLFVTCFDSLLHFHAYLNRLQSQVGSQGLFYGEAVDFEKEVAVLIGQFTSAWEVVDGAFASTVRH